jgi:head-tail adaptor
LSLNLLLSETATVVRYGTAVDEYGNIIRGAATNVVYDARLEQLSSDEIVRDRDTIVADWRIFLPPDADISPYDRVEARGHIFEVSGLPNEQKSPRAAHHIEARLRFVT